MNASTEIVVKLIGTTKIVAKPPSRVLTAGIMRLTVLRLTIAVKMFLMAASQVFYWMTAIANACLE